MIFKGFCFKDQRRKICYDIWDNRIISNIIKKGGNACIDAMAEL